MFTDMNCECVSWVCSISVKKVFLESGICIYCVSRHISWKWVAPCCYLTLLLRHLQFLRNILSPTHLFKEKNKRAGRLEYHSESGQRTKNGVKYLISSAWPALTLPNILAYLSGGFYGLCNPEPFIHTWFFATSTVHQAYDKGWN